MADITPEEGCQEGHTAPPAHDTETRQSDKLKPTSDINRTNRSAWLSIPKAAKRYGLNERTLRRWCESGEIPAMAERKKSYTVYLVTPQAVELALSNLNTDIRRGPKSSPKPHIELLPIWIKALERGTLTGKVFSPETISYYGSYVSDFIRSYKTLTIKTLREELAKIPPAQFAKRYKLHKGIMSFARFLIAEGQLESKFEEEAKVLSPKRHEPPKRSTVSAEGLEALINACSAGSDSALITLIANTGLRASEVCNLQLQDLDIANGVLTVRKGKGGKTRKVGLNAGARMALSKHIYSLPTAKPTQSLFLDTEGNTLNRTSLYHQLERIGKLAGVKVSPHALRRAFVTLNANAGRPLQMLQMACGHSDIKTTMSYCRTSERDLLEAMKDW